MSSAAAETKQSIKVLDELLAKLNLSSNAEEKTHAADNLASFINGPIEEQE